jgi:Domain of unknown function (DUF1848)
MIISASRRTDIPAFYSEWFFNRLQAGYVLVRNPMNPQMISRISLSKKLIDCIVFWTKNPAPMLTKLHLLKEYPFYFLFTLTPYGRDLECQLREKKDIIQTFIDLSKQVGKNRVIWRYDPIILSNTMDENFHYRHFEEYASRLSSFTNRCIISFLDMYKKCERNLRGLNIHAIDKETMLCIAAHLNLVAQKYGIQIMTCAETIDFTSVGVPEVKCIDDQLINGICGYPIDAAKDRNQRKTCGCITSIDIGAYNSCNHICLYCYANADPQRVKENIQKHDPDSPLMLGQLTGYEKITDRKVQSLKLSGRLF